MKFIKELWYMATIIVIATYYRIKQIFTGIDETNPRNNLELSRECNKFDCVKCIYGLCECFCHAKSQPAKDNL